MKNKLLIIIALVLFAWLWNLFTPVHPKREVRREMPKLNQLAVMHSTVAMRQLQ